MEVDYYGKGPVGTLCRGVLAELGVKVRPHGVTRPVDLLISVHWDRLFSKAELQAPRIGALNLHNSYLPWNRGSHACTWAIVDRTPGGATMHWMDEGIDTGDILYQEPLSIMDDETADQLYKRTVGIEVKVFRVGMELLLAGNYRRTPQPKGGTIHYKRDFQRLIRAVTTNDCRVIRAEA